MSKQYETVIGLEVHVELATKTKIFCGCSTAFGGAPNTHTCPVCTGMPGSLPVLNKQVVEYAVAVGLATNCQITQYCKFDRKNYFYPDNPQNYQISQLYLPICRNGHVDIETEQGTKSIGIHEIHMEEDAGKLIRSLGDTYFARDEKRIYAYGKQLPKAELTSWELLGHWYSRDAKRVYYLNREIKGADRDSFTVCTPMDAAPLADHLARDKDHFYQNDEMIDETLWLERLHEIT